MSVASLKGWNRGMAEPRKGAAVVYYTAPGSGKRAVGKMTSKKSVVKRGSVKRVAIKPSRTKQRR
jgi:hypothetical protein